jgi:maltose alpha-D-glucosyltransferase/alpha-amylase
VLDTGVAAPTLTAPADLDSLLRGSARGELARLLPGYIRARRWFRSKARRIKGVSLHDLVDVPVDGLEARLALFDVEYIQGEAETYVLPLALAPAEEAEAVVRDAPQAVVAYVAPAGTSASAASAGNEAAGQRWLLYDALYDPRFAEHLLKAVGARKRLPGRRGELTATPTRAFRTLRGPGGVALEPRVGRAEQSNTSIVFGDRLVLKVFRRIEPGVNPELEVGIALTDRGFEHVAAVGGWLAYRSPKEEASALGIVQEFVPNEGDAWDLTLDSVSSFFERVAARQDPPPEGPSPTVAATLESSEGELPQVAADTIGEYLDVAGLLGSRTAELHRALCAITEDAAFAPEPFSALHQRSVYQTMRNHAASVFGLLRQRRDSLPPHTSGLAARALDLAPEIQGRLGGLTQSKVSCARIRTHGDFHTGQVLWTGKDVVFIDFEGEPGRPLSERRHKRSAMTDVAGMLRSFHYAAFGTLVNPRVGGAVRPEDVALLEPWANYWYLWVAATYLRAYLAEATGQPFLPRDRAEVQSLLDLAMLQKVLYELDYELNNRPEWVSIPLRGLLDLLAPTEAAAPAN